MEQLNRDINAVIPVVLGEESVLITWPGELSVEVQLGKPDAHKQLFERLKRPNIMKEFHRTFPGDQRLRRDVLGVAMSYTVARNKVGLSEPHP